MRQLPLYLRYYLAAVYVAGLVIATIAYVFRKPGEGDVIATLVFLVLIAIINGVPVRYAGSMSIHLATALDIAAAWVLPPTHVLLIMAFGNIVIHYTTKRAWYRSVFNISFHSISVGMVAFIFSYIIRNPIPSTLHDVAWIVVGCTVYIVLCMFFMGMVLTLADPSGYSFRSLERQIRNAFTYIDVVLFVYGVVLGCLWLLGPYTFILGLLPLLAMHWSMRINADLHRATVQQQQMHEALMGLLATGDSTKQLDLLLKQLWHIFPVEQASVVIFGSDSSEDIRNFLKSRATP